VFSTLDAGPVIIVTSAAAVAEYADRSSRLRSAGAQLQIHDAARRDDVRLAAAVERLAESGVTSLMLEGGPALHRAAWDEGIIDRVQIFVTPRPVGALGTPWLAPDVLRIAPLAEMTVEPIGEDVLIQGMVAANVHRPR
jgi:diaminohydroxyphosphoribosylaminopyrimidine deaminase/5-amino-6-(5-phosphoribosylamino)uracil reductase